MLYATSSARDILLGPLSCVIHHTLPVLVSPPRRNTALMGNPKIGNVCVLVNQANGPTRRKNSHKSFAFLSLPVKGHGVDGVLVAVDDVDALPLGDVPHEDEVVVPGGQQDVLGRRVPLQVHDAPSA